MDIRVGLCVHGCMDVCGVSMGGYEHGAGYVVQAREEACATACVKDGLPVETGEFQQQ